MDASEQPYTEFCDSSIIRGSDTVVSVWQAGDEFNEAAPGASNSGSFTDNIFRAVASDMASIGESLSSAPQNSNRTLALQSNRCSRFTEALRNLCCCANRNRGHGKRRKETYYVLQNTKVVSGIQLQQMYDKKTAEERLNGARGGQRDNRRRSAFGLVQNLARKDSFRAAYTAKEVQVLTEKFHRYSDSPANQKVKTVSARALSSLFKLSEEQSKAIFDRFDKDKNGQLNLGEFFAGFAHLKEIQSGADNQIQLAFRLFDTDGNGELDESEFLEVIRGTYLAKSIQLQVQLSRATVNSAGSSGDLLEHGGMSCSEEEECGRVASELFKTLDTDGTNGITFEEFERWMNSSTRSDSELETTGRALAVRGEHRSVVHALRTGFRRNLPSGSARDLPMDLVHTTDDL
jgi:Ca2+-binding EF-hand superfamily protein